MKLKIYAITGLFFLVLNQIMLLQGNDFIQSQEPIDFAHWLLLLGVLFCLAINYIFSNGIFNSTASILTSIGIIALSGQAIIDFIWWSYGTDYEGLISITNQIMSKPSIRIPFITIGPAFFYLGLATHAGKCFKKSKIWSLITILGIIITGLGSFVMESRETIALGHLILFIGLVNLIIRREILMKNSMIPT